MLCPFTKWWHCGSQKSNDLPAVIQEVRCRLESWTCIFGFQVTSPWAVPLQKLRMTGTPLSECHFLPRVDVGMCPHTEAVPGGGLVAQLGLAQHRGATLYRWWGGCLHSGRASQCWRAWLSSFWSRSDNIPLLAAMYSLLQSCASKWLCSSFAQSRCKWGPRIRPMHLCTFLLLESFHKVFFRLHFLLPSHGFPFGLFE